MQGKPDVSAVSQRSLRGYSAPASPIPDLSLDAREDRQSSSTGSEESAQEEDLLLPQ